MCNVSFVKSMIRKIENNKVYNMKDFAEAVSGRTVSLSAEVLCKRAKDVAKEVNTGFDYSMSEIAHAVNELRENCEKASGVIPGVPEAFNLPEYYRDFAKGCYKLIWGDGYKSACQNCPKRYDSFCLASVVKAASEMVFALVYADTVQLDTNFRLWDQKLCRIDDASGVNRKFLVSFSRGLDLLRVRYGIISCSVVGDGNYHTYQDREYGFLFHPKKHEIVGMSPSDSGTVVAKYGLRDELAVLAEILFGNIVFGEKFVLNGVLSDFQTCWQMDEFLKKTTTYNEIVLKGDTAPIGVFALRSAWKERADELYVVCKVMDLPLVVLDTITGVSEVYRCNSSRLPQHAEELFHGV